MKIKIKPLLAAALATALTLSTVVPSIAAATKGDDSFDPSTASPLIVTENVTTGPNKTRFTYTEIYNNSDSTINFKDYTFYYDYPTGGGQVFTTGGQDVLIESGKTLVLWQSKGAADTGIADGNGKTVEDFNRYYGTHLVENKDIFRVTYTGIHNTAYRMFRFGKDRDTIIAEAFTNVDGVDLPTGNPDKLAVQYTYPRTGMTSTKTGVSQATPGSVDPSQVPAQRMHLPGGEEQPEITSAIGAASVKNDDLTVQASVSGVVGAMGVNLFYRQNNLAGGSGYPDAYTKVPMTRTEGTTYTAAVDRNQLCGSDVEWYVKAGYGGAQAVESDKKVTAVEDPDVDPQTAAPLIVTEVSPNPGRDENGAGQFSYMEIYNRTNQPINLSYYKIFYYYNYGVNPADKTWSIGDATTLLQPGKTMVLWLSSDGTTTVDDFNKHYKTNLVENQDIVRINYAGFHSSDQRWVRLGHTEATAFVMAAFNQGAADIQTADGTSVQYTYPRTNDNICPRAKVTAWTPGTVESWQIPAGSIDFRGYEGYPADDGSKPTLKVCPDENLPVPASIDEGEALRVMYEVDLLSGATSDARKDAFQDNIDPANPSNMPGGSEALKNRPYLMGTEILYKLDDDAEFTSIKEQKQWRLGHYLMQIPSDILFGHKKVTFKVRAYSLYGMNETAESTVRINALNETDGVRLNVSDGDVLSGAQTVTANDGGDNADTKIQLDGQDVPSAPVLEDGAYFAVTCGGLNNYFKNALTAAYNGNDRDIITFYSPWAEAPNSRVQKIDNKYFTHEDGKYKLKLTMWAGDAGTPFEEIYDVVKTENHEDYTATHLQLRLTNGKSYAPVKIAPDNEKTNTSTDYDATHTIGDSAGMVPHMDIYFEIPEEEVNAVGAVIDTAQLSEGSHTITASSGEQTKTASVTVDNTAPEIDLGIAEGSAQYGVLNIDPAFKDASGVDHAVVSLDGNEMSLPAAVDTRRLAVGEHTIQVVAEDVAGNIATKELHFTTEAVDPRVSDSDNDGITATSANLSVSLGGDKADVTFFQGKSLTLDNGGISAQETAAGQPMTIQNGNQPLQVSAPNGEFPYQLFTVNTGALSDSDTVAVSWNGSASYTDASHTLALYALNRASNSWEQVGTADASGNIQASFAAKDHVADGKAALLVQCRTNGTSPTAAAPRAAAADSKWDGTSAPANYDFAFAWETDTQYYTESFPYHYDNMNQWIVDNAKKWKIRYTLHTGDIVDDVDMTGEWINADHSMKIFDDAGMPYGVLGGNHDVFAGAEDYGNYWKYFGEDRFKDKEYYGGSYKNNLGHYDLLTENGQDIIVLYMSWDIYQNEIDWMNQVLAQYKDRKAIIALHRYANVNLNSDNQLLDYTGKLLQDQVVAKNSNVIAVLNGHYHGATIQTDAFDDNGDGVDDRNVYQICTDYQSDPEGGSEYIKFLYFDLANDKIYVNSYSPYRNDFNYFDTPRLDSYGDGTVALQMDVAELDVDFDTTEKTMTTNSLTVDVQTGQAIGGVDNASGDVNYLWQGLAPDTEYGWYARVTNDKQGITTTPVKTFRTETAAVPASYTITAQAGKGGSISNLGDTSVAEGGSLTYTIIPSFGYRTAQLLVDGEPVQLAGNTYTFNDVRANHTIAVQFELIPAEEKADLSKLQAIVEKVDKTDLSGYNEQDLALLNSLLAQARGMLQSGSLTADDQPEIDRLTTQLSQALEDLLHGGSSEGNPSNSSSGSGKPGASAPVTGEAPVAALAGAAVVCGGLLAAGIRRKRNQK